MISVIIPAFDEAKALPDAAALARRHAQFETIVVDGGSRDPTRDIARAFPGVRLVHAPKGRACQMNAGARVATGDWLVFLHAARQRMRKRRHAHCGSLTGDDGSCRERVILGRTFVSKWAACFVCAAALTGSTAATPLAGYRGALAETFIHADFGEFPSSTQARRLAHWVVRTGDHENRPFLIIDKRAASAMLFDATGKATAAAPVLLGIAKGDEFEPGSAAKNMYDTSLEERITPAGRFAAQRGIDDKGKDVLWIHYDAGIALHAVLDNPGERRRERLASPSPDDNRISYGCVNVPTEFYAQIVRPTFENGGGIVYVLPETQSAMSLLEARMRQERVAAAVARALAAPSDSAR